MKIQSTGQSVKSTGGDNQSSLGSNESQLNSDGNSHPKVNVDNPGRVYCKPEVQYEKPTKGTEMISGGGFCNNDAAKEKC